MADLMYHCIFCKIIKRKAPARIIDENDDIIVFLSFENHPLIVPKKHIPDIYSMDNKSASAVMIEAVKIANAVKKGLDCDGINLVQANEKAAHQDVFHFHLHIKPRWIGDDVVLHWNTDNKSEETLNATYEKIKKSLAA